jgi:hypothetical protein
MKIGFNVTIGSLNLLPTNARERRSNAVIGEGKHIWPETLRHFGDGKPFYAQASPGQFDLPDPEKYSRRPMRTCRGCSRHCKFQMNAPV